VNVLTEELQLSVAVGLPVLTGKVLAVQRIVTLAGQFITGPTLSVTLMTWLQVLKLPQSSCDFQVRVIVYFCGQVPATVASVNVMVGVASQLSLEVGEPVLAGNVLAVHRIVTFAGQLMTGAMRSATVMIWLQFVVLPHSSVALHVLVIVLFWGQAGEITTTSA
jgi:hypothetical protein